MDTHANAQLHLVRPLVVGKRLLGLDSGRHCVGRAFENR